MRSIAIIGLGPSPPCPALGQTTDGSRPQAPDLASGKLPPEPIRHRQPGRAEVKECKSERRGAGARMEGAPSADRGNEPIKVRLLTARMARLHLDEPLGGERRHHGLCMCRIGAPRTWNNPGELDAIAITIKTRNAGNAIIWPIPAITRRSNEAATQACMNELSR